jgi:dipeptidyl aminopeptidase/acylaminoacyl peptidase
MVIPCWGKGWERKEMKAHQLLMVGLITGGLVSCSENSLEPDTTPPAAITDLQVTTGGEALTWTAPGDDGTKGQVIQYDVRYASGDLVAKWDSALTLPFPGTPAFAGRTETLALPGLEPGSWQFGIRSSDEVPNWSDLSNVVTVSVVPDTTAPARVTDLAVTGMSGLSVELGWTATGDDGVSGQAEAYDLRYAEGPITDQNWQDATLVEGVGIPGTGGAMETFAVIGLDPGIEYGFALVVSDDAGNWSSLSNTVTATIPNPIRLETGTVVANQPDWSPDGKQIVFTGYQSQLYVVSTAGGIAVRYTENPDGVSRPDWSPDGAKLAFSRRVRIGNRSSLVLSLMEAWPNAPPEDLANHDTLRVQWPRWSPDGSSIAYGVTEFNPPAPIAGSIYTISSLGGEPTLAGGDLEPAGLDWSPDGGSIVYSDRQDGVYDLWVVNANGGSPTQLTTEAGDKGGPAWSPDGAMIAYVEFGGAIWIVPSSGGNPTQVDTGAGTSSSTVHWSPNSRSIVYDAIDGTLSSIWIQRVR